MGKHEPAVDLHPLELLPTLPWAADFNNESRRCVLDQKIRCFGSTYPSTARLDLARGSGLLAFYFV